MDKELEALLNRLLDSLISVQVENKVLWAHFNYYKRHLPPRAEIEEMVEQAKNDPAVGGRLRESYAGLRARFSEQLSLAEVLQEVLKVFPVDRNMN